ncbi:hypothetical protein G5B00_15145 [Parapedobacter sp. SGR-10]|uniref:hypothetical protein n=1 Tax=Parapedobacter sp. SGR-10 TaxID=2710879 RepID=UPI0013D1657B|nr:hypothetical protein [Parapedobacter sp. SGR-10]NGF57854.1 hypothetical protein [Parapedobacter sp. SGR-10]
MVKKIVQNLLVICSVWMLTGCFDVVEEVDINSNGSGRIKATVNLSKSKTKVASLMKLDKVDGIKIPSKTEIQKEADAIVRLLKQTSGISDVQSSLDFDNYIATLSCSFNDVKALNAFSKILSAHFKVELSTYSSYSYDPAARVFGRNYTYNAEVKKEFAKLKTDNQESFNQAHFTSIYRFQDHVARQQHANAKISPNKKAVMLKVRATDLINGKVNLSNRITLSK